MKRLLPFTLFIVLLSSAIAQIPQGISYQAVIRDANGNLVINSPIGISIQILQGSPGGALAYQEWHFPNSNNTGLVSFVIGQGQLPSTNFADISWENGPYFLAMGVDPTGGTNPSIHTSVQFNTVPYSFVAENAQGLTLRDVNGKIYKIMVDTTGNLYTQKYGQPCPGVPTVSDIDGNVYNTVLIGNQCWMKENLKVATNPLGIAIQRFCYNNLSSNCTDYGGMYSWHTMMNGAGSSNGNPSGVQGICPDGWHLPSDSEWLELQGYVASVNPTAIGNQLKSCRQDASPQGATCNTTVHPRWDADPLHYGIDYFGFSALPGGHRSGAGIYAELGSNGIFWTTTQSSSNNSFTRSLYNNSPNVNGGSFFAREKTEAMSVRCIRDVSQVSIPTVITDPITGITQNTAFSGGDVTHDGGSSVILRGVCWNTSPNPTTSHFTTSDGSGNGAFVSSLTALSPNTVYFVRAYATNSAGTAYGNEFQFTTNATIQLPTVLTSSITTITGTTANGGGDVINDGGSPVTEYGVCWSTTPNPTTNDLQTVDGSGTGSFSSLIPNLAPQTLYYVRAYATNSVGTSYGNQESFTTLSWDCGDQISDINGNLYNTILIGGQCWMKENYKATKYRNGVSIDYPGMNNSAWLNNTTGAYAWFDNDIYWKDFYGALYNWHAITNLNGLCPSGWVVPDENAWNILISHVGGTSVAGGALKSTRTHPDAQPRWHSPNTGATDVSGFSAYPGGVRHGNGSFEQFGNQGVYGSTTLGAFNLPAARMLRYDHQDIIMGGQYGMNGGYSVRCVKH